MTRKTVTIPISPLVQSLAEAIRSAGDQLRARTEAMRQAAEDRGEFLVFHLGSISPDGRRLKYHVDFRNGRELCDEFRPINCEGIGGIDYDEHRVLLGERR